MYKNWVSEQDPVQAVETTTVWKDEIAILPTNSDGSFRKTKMSKAYFDFVQQQLS